MLGGFTTMFHDYVVNCNGTCEKLKPVQATSIH